MPNKNKARFIMYHGLPGSGKSTQAEKQRQALEKAGIKATIVNRDTIRENLFGKDYQQNSEGEKEVTRVQEALIRNALSKGETVISDDTNLNPNFIPSLLKLAKEYKAPVSQVYVDTPLEVALERNRLRGEAGGRFVPEFVLRRMAKDAFSGDGKKLKRIEIDPEKLTAKRELGVTRGSLVLSEASKKLTEENPITDSKKVLLVDVDGTLSDDRHAANRAFYDPKKKDYDYFFKSIKFSEHNPEVIHLANQLREKEDMTIMVLTGRTDSNAEDLLDFVKRSGLKASRVIAKKEGDYRIDGAFKTEILEGLRKEGFDLAHSLDDRETSVKAYEALGIPVSRVEPHAPEDPVLAPKVYPPLEINTPYTDYLPDSYYERRGLERPKKQDPLSHQEGPVGNSSQGFQKAGDYHLSSDGKVRLCRDEKQACPYGAERHGDSPEAIYEKFAEKEGMSASRSLSSEAPSLSIAEARYEKLLRDRQERPVMKVTGNTLEGARIRTLGRGGNYWGAPVPDELLEDAHKALAEILTEDEYKEYTEKKKKRDRGKSHLTVVPPANSQRLFKEGKDLGSLADSTYSMKVVGIGKAEDKAKGSEAYYAIIDSPEIKAKSRELGLPEQDLHVTLGFKNSDVHGVSKGTETLIKKF